MNNFDKRRCATRDKGIEGKSLRNLHFAELLFVILEPISRVRVAGVLFKKTGNNL
jgi:hypothetical protein